MKLTKAAIVKHTQRALAEQGLSARIDSVTWAGERTQDRRGPLYSRTAFVTLETQGRRVRKIATLWTDNSFRIA